MSAKNRNHICPLCGEKLKRCECHIRPSNLSKTPAIYSSSLILLIFAFVFWRYVQYGEGVGGGMSVANPISIRTHHLHDLEEKYIKARAGGHETWWLVNPPRSKEEANLFVSEKHAEVMKTILTYRDVSPLAQEIAQHYRECIVSVHLGGQASMTTADNPADVKGKPEICFVPRVVATKLKEPFSLYWRSDWGLIMNGVNYPPKIFPGFLFHELGHGLRHPVSPTTVQFPQFSPQYNAEEVEMHHLEAQVFDRASGGQYFRVIDSFVSRHAGAQTLESFLPTITVDDLLELDGVLGVTSVGNYTAGMLYVEHVMAIGYRFAKAHSLQEQTVGEELYVKIHDVVLR